MKKLEDSGMKYPGDTKPKLDTEEAEKAYGKASYTPNDEDWGKGVSLNAKSSANGYNFISHKNYDYDVAENYMTDKHMNRKANLDFPNHGSSIDPDDKEFLKEYHFRDKGSPKNSTQTSLDHRTKELPASLKNILEDSNKLQ